ncbi:MAG: FtsW/RodA/SpoVE family cell cycle protein [bacterium]|nr:FtsW/RodA/SpoVE family cell cycle protein [bacterium]
MRSTFKKMDKLLLLLMLVFTIFGLVMIFSASSITAVLYNGASESYYFRKQLIVVIASWIIGFSIVLKLKTKSYELLAPAGMIAILISLILVFSYGTITNGSKSWFDLGFASIQPSEFLKPVMIVYLGVYFDKLLKKKNYNIFLIFIPFILIGACFILTALQPDLGTALIIAGIAGIVFMYLPINTKQMKKIKIGCAIAAVIGLILIFTYSLNGEQTSRLTFSAPCTRYTEKTGYQVCNGMIAISNGGLFGVGLGNSTQKYLYLPEAHTDFIFPIVCEELGAVTGAIIILLYLVLLIRLLQIARKAGTVKGYIIALGTFAYILLHLLVNFMGILALIPLTGVPVPFLSYGGSYYLCLIMMLFVCERVVIESKAEATKKIIKSI